MTEDGHRDTFYGFDGPYWRHKEEAERETQEILDDPETMAAIAEAQMEIILDKLGSDYDEDGVPYWEKDDKRPWDVV